MEDNINNLTMQSPRIFKKTENLNVNRGAPSFEQCLTHILGSLEFVAGIQKPDRLTPKQKQYFRGMENHPQRLEMAQYRQILRRLLNQSLCGVRQWARMKADALDEELRMLLARYENLRLQVRTGTATSKQVRWSLVNWFFIPWVALRLAFHLRNVQRGQIAEDECWFLPSVHGNAIDSCFLNVVDRYVRRREESDYALIKRLRIAGRKKAYLLCGGDLGRDLRRCKSPKITTRNVSDATISLIAWGSRKTADLKIMLVLARAIDRNVKTATKHFGQKKASELVDFYGRWFAHFKQRLSDLDRDPDFPKDDAEASWQLLQSPTFTGNTPVEWRRFYPLMDPFMSELARHISDELSSLTSARRFPALPQVLGQCDIGRFSMPNSTPLPLEIEERIQMKDVSGAVEVSESLFNRDRKDPALAASVGRFFCKRGLMTFDPNQAGCSVSPSREDAAKLMSEGARLMRLAHAQAGGRQKADCADQFLRFLLQPHRPKHREDRELARAFFGDVEKEYGKAGREGSAAYLRGCLLWMEGEDAEAVNAFLGATRMGNGSCGDDWVPLLRLGVILAEGAFPRQLKRFLKLAELHGVFGGHGSPRTDALAAEMRYEEFAAEFRQSFQVFPR